MKNFVKNGELELVNGGYLVNKESNPITNEAFVNAQTQAEYIVTFAQIAEGKDLKGKKADSLHDIKKEVDEFLNKNKPVKFIENIESIERPLTDKLTKEALDFINYKDKSSEIDKVNAFMQQFVILKEFEEFGLFFEEGVVKLNKIYTVEEITTAVKKVINLL